MRDHTITTGRITLLAAQPEEFDACLAGDRACFAALTGATPPDPFLPPPETGDVMAWFRDAIVADPDIGPWFFYWVVDPERGRLVGSGGYAGRPDEHGRVYIGYSTYPEDEGKGYASEVAGALVAWALTQSGVTQVRATIKPDNVASQRVATRAGMTRVGEVTDDKEGLLDLWSAPAMGDGEASNEQ